MNRKSKSTGLLIEDVGGASSSKTLFLLVKAFVGTGVIFLPKAFYAGGLLPSIVMMAFSAIISTMAGVFLVNTAAIIPGTYQDMSGTLYGATFKKLVLTGLGIGQLCFSMTYILFIAGNVKDLISTVSGCQTQVGDVSLIVLAELIIFIPMILMRNMKSFAMFALAGNVTIICAITYILYNGFVELGKGKIEPRIVTDFQGLIMIFNVSIMAYSGIGLLIPIRQAMASPKAMPGLIKLVMIILFVLFSVVGGVSSLAYGKSTETIILLNMPNGILLQLLQFGYVFAITVSVPLQVFF